MRALFFSFSLLLFLFLSWGCHRAAPRQGPIFDVASLVGRRMAEIDKILGAPAANDENTPIPNAGEARKTWRRDGCQLSIDYLVRNNRVTNFSLAPDDASRAWSEEEKAARLADFNLREGDARYALEWLEDANKPLRFSGLRVTPAAIKYQVVLRVSGANGLVSVRYSPLQAGDEGGIMTLPPWEVAFSAQTGTVVTIEAGPFQEPGKMPTIGGKTTVQIIVDGKVMAEKSSEGGVASCALEL